jgi:hypothetical protein
MCKLYTEELQTHIISALADVFKSQIKQYERSLQAKKFLKDVSSGTERCIGVIDSIVTKLALKGVLG